MKFEVEQIIWSYFVLIVVHICSQVEKEGSSEATAVADNSDRNEPEVVVSEGRSMQEQQSEDSHEADSTSHPQTSAFSSQPSDCSVAVSATSCSETSESSPGIPSPAIEPESALTRTTDSDLSQAASPPGSTDATPSPTAAPLPPSPSDGVSSGEEEDTPEPTSITSPAASTSTASHSDSTVSQGTEKMATDSSTEKNQDTTEKDIASVSCSSSLEGEDKAQPMEED